MKQLHYLSVVGALGALFAGVLVLVDAATVIPLAELLSVDYPIPTAVWFEAGEVLAGPQGPLVALACAASAYGAVALGRTQHVAVVGVELLAAGLLIVSWKWSAALPWTILHDVHHDEARPHHWEEDVASLTLVLGLALLCPFVLNGTWGLLESFRRPTSRVRLAREAALVAMPIVLLTECLLAPHSDGEWPLTVAPWPLVVHSTVLGLVLIVFVGLRLTVKRPLVAGEPASWAQTLRILFDRLRAPDE